MTISGYISIKGNIVLTITPIFSSYKIKGNKMTLQIKKIRMKMVLLIHKLQSIFF